MSLPVRERGLKYRGMMDETRSPEVAPCAGAWIEIFFIIGNFITSKVAPCAGAWIEIIL